MSLSAHLDEMVHRYTVGRESLRQIAARYGSTRETVRALLIAAGVRMARPGRPTGFSPGTRAPEPPPKRDLAKVYLSGLAEDLDAGNARHVTAVRQTLGGFPMY